MTLPGISLDGGRVSVFRPNSEVRSALGSLAVACGMVIGGCDESLPPRTHPPLPASVSVVIASGHHRVNMVSTPRGDSISSINPYLRLDILFSNDYTEVMQDSADIEGTVEIWRTDRPELRSTLDLRGAGVFPTPGYPGHQITLRPGDQVDISIFWSNLASVPTGDTIPVWQGIPTSPVDVVDPRTGQTTTIQVTDTVHLQARATVKVFAATGYVTSPTAYQGALYDIWPPDTAGSSSVPIQGTQRSGPGLPGVKSNFASPTRSVPDDN